jgi:hypothetical protein
MGKIITVTLLLIFSLTPQAAEQFNLPVSLVKAFFAQQNADNKSSQASNIKYPFKLTDLSQIIKQLQPSDSASIRQNTQDYLNTTYPAGKISLLSVIQADLPQTVKQLVLGASAHNVVLKASLDELWTISSDDLSFIASKVWLSPGKAIAAKTLLDKIKPHKSNLLWGAYAQMSDVYGQEYRYSVASSKHPVGTILDITRGTSLSILFTSKYCDADKCYTKIRDGHFASFKIPLHQRTQLNGLVSANCDYEAIYRRDYLKHQEVELAFQDCTINSTGS